MHYNRTKMHGPKSVFILDNINCICPLINKDAPPNLVETIKSEKFSEIIQTWIEKQEVHLLALCRHYSQVNPSLFQVNYMDTLLELKAPSKDQR